jgi:hypothetical protein
MNSLEVLRPQNLTHLVHFMTATSHPIFTISDLGKIFSLLGSPTSDRVERLVPALGIPFVSVVQTGTFLPCWESAVSIKVQSSPVEAAESGEAADETAGNGVEVTLAQLKQFERQILKALETGADLPRFRIHHLEHDEMKTEFHFKSTYLTVQKTGGGGWRIENAIKVQFP